MLTNADITIYNREYIPETRLDVWHRTVIRNVNFYADNKVQHTDSGLKSADSFKVRIPEESPQKPYLEPESYAAAGNKESYWTLREGDYVVRGVCEEEIQTPKDLKKELRQVFKITSWSDNRRGGLCHWRIGGV